MEASALTPYNPNSRVGRRFTDSIHSGLGPGDSGGTALFAPRQYHSYSGTDMLAVMHIPHTSVEDMIKSGVSRRNAEAYHQRGANTKIFAELATISMSSARSVHPVRRLGESHVHKYTRGARTVAGTMVFAVLDRDVFAEVYRDNPQEVQSVAPFFVDQIPEFNIYIAASNEYGGQGSEALIGITLTNFGKTVSVDDIFTEVTYCVDRDTEALTHRGWKKYTEIEPDDLMLTIDPVTREICWQSQTLHCFFYTGPMVHWQNYRGVDMLTTPNHRWLTKKAHQWAQYGEDSPWEFRETRDIDGQSVRVLLGGGKPSCFAEFPIYQDELVELVGWIVTEGTRCYTSKGNAYAYTVAQDEVANPANTDRLRQLVNHFKDRGASCKEYDSNRAKASQKDFYFGKNLAREIDVLIPGRALNPDFLRQLTLSQAQLLKEVILQADGHDGRVFIQNIGPNAEMFQMLCAMLGQRSVQREHHHPCRAISVYKTNTLNGYGLEPKTIDYQGAVWCPRTNAGTWLARRNGCTFWTGNTYVAQFYVPFVQDYNAFERLIKLQDEEESKMRPASRIIAPQGGRADAHDDFEERQLDRAIRETENILLSQTRI